MTGAQRQNFANWFQYYRNRELVAKGLAARLGAAADGLRGAYATCHQTTAVGGEALGGGGGKKGVMTKISTIVTMMPKKNLNTKYNKYIISFLLVHFL